LGAGAAFFLPIPFSGWLQRRPVLRYNQLRGKIHGHRINNRLKRKEKKMKNVEMTVEGNTLTIKVDLTKDFGPSSSGKTIIISSTEGNISIPNRDEKIGLNVYRKKPQ
jgi:hypothetical protein